MNSDWTLHEGSLLLFQVTLSKPSGILPLPPATEPPPPHKWIIKDHLRVICRGNETVYARTTSSSILALATAEQSHRTVTVAASVVLHRCISVLFPPPPPFVRKISKYLKPKLAFRPCNSRRRVRTFLLLWYLGGDGAGWAEALPPALPYTPRAAARADPQCRYGLPGRGSQRHCDGRSPSPARRHRADTTVGQQRAPRRD